MTIDRDYLFATLADLVRINSINPTLAAGGGGPLPQTLGPRDAQRRSPRTRRPGAAGFERRDGQLMVDRSTLPELGPERSFAFPAIHRTTLANGVRVWSVQHRQVPLIAVLHVETDPPGATVFIGRKDLGPRGNTPVALGLTPGSYKVMIAKFVDDPASHHTAARKREVDPFDCLTIQNRERLARFVRLPLAPRDAHVAAF